MKQRITYLLPEGSQAEPADVKVDKDSLNFSRADEADEEWRLTLGINDLPEEVRSCHIMFCAVLVLNRGRSN